MRENRGCIWLFYVELDGNKCSALEILVPKPGFFYGQNPFSSKLDLYLWWLVAVTPIDGACHLYSWEEHHECYFISRRFAWQLLDTAQMNSFEAKARQSKGMLPNVCKQPMYFTHIWTAMVLEEHFMELCKYSYMWFIVWLHYYPWFMSREMSTEKISN